MKKCALILLCISLVLFVTVLSCDNTPPGGSSLYSITIDETVYETSTAYSFGLTETGSTGKTITLVLKNTGDTDIAVSAIALSDTVNYSITTPALPHTAAAGSTVTTSVIFKPQTSETHAATVSITVEGFADPFVLNLTGQGNYAPTVKFGIEVSDSKNADTNGFYERESALLNNKPKYTKSVLPVYYCYSYENDGYLWCFHNNTDASWENHPLYDEDRSGVMVPPVDGWLDSVSDPQPLKVSRYDITGTGGFTNELLTANYKYYDAEGDIEDSVSYQWYASDTENGTYTAISGETGKTYTPSDKSGKYIKVEVTPTAKTGITAGTPVMSSPTVQIQNPLI